MQYCSVLFPNKINSPLITAKMLYPRVVCGSSLVNLILSVFMFKEENRREKTAYQMRWQSRLVDQSRKALAITSITDFVSLHVRPFSTLTETPVFDLIQMESSVSERGECEMEKKWKFQILETHPLCSLVT